MTAYYNEIDPFAAQWLRNLIDKGLIASGVVDTRSIEDVKPNELMGYTQCHFFAGIGVWSYALRNAGWPDDKPVWTGSCPCQPFSSAGAQAGFADERHLWPAFQWLIEQCRPSIVFGEQVASKAAEPWIDLVQADLEALGYAFGAVPFPSAGVGAPHIRDRLFWVGNADQPGLERLARNGGEAGREGEGGPAAPAGVSGGLGDTNGQPTGRDAGAAHPTKAEHGTQDGHGYGLGDAGDPLPRGLANTDSKRRGETREGFVPGGQTERTERDSRDNRPGPTNGFWADADWLLCRDGKWRPVEPGTFPLVDGATARVGRLRAYGNAINVEAARAFIECAM